MMIVSVMYAGIGVLPGTLPRHAPQPRRPGQAAKLERPAAGLLPDVRRDGEQGGDDQTDLGLLLGGQQLAQRALSQRLALGRPADGEKQHGGLGDQRTAPGIVRGREFQRLDGDVGGGRRIQRAQGVRRAGQQRDRRLIAGVGAIG